MTFTEQVATQVIPGLATIVAGVITAGIAVALRWIAERSKSARLQAAAARVSAAADKVVRDLSNTVVDAIKKASVDGTISAEDRQMIKNAAVDNLKKYLGTIGMNDVVNVLGYKTADEITVALSTEIESSVFRMRLQTEAVKAAPVVAVASATATPVV